MFKHTAAISLVIALLVAVPSAVGGHVTGEGMGIIADRVMTGARTGTLYYSSKRGLIILPHAKGGMLSFDLWNTLTGDDHATVTSFTATVGDKRIHIQNYANRRHIRERYAELSNLAAAGLYRITLAVPPGTARVPFSGAGSKTGCALSDVSFSETHHPLPLGYERRMVRSAGAVHIAARRAYTGTESGRRYYGGSEGTLFMPHDKGGRIGVTLWVSHPAAVSSCVASLVFHVGDTIKTVNHSTSHADRREWYRHLREEMGPAGGMTITIAIPKGVHRVDYRNDSPGTECVISDVTFTE